MDNYEINILRRNGNWKKVKQDNLVTNSNPKDHKDIDTNVYENLNNDFVFNLNQVNEIINKLENLENEKNNLKNELKKYEQEFINKKNDAENKINTITKERDILNKTINVIKSLKTF